MIAMAEVCRQHIVGIVRRCRRNYRGEGGQLGSLLGEVWEWLCVCHGSRVIFRDPSLPRQGIGSGGSEERDESERVSG